VIRPAPEIFPAEKLRHYDARFERMRAARVDAEVSHERVVPQGTSFLPCLESLDVAIFVERVHARLFRHCRERRVRTVLMAHLDFLPAERADLDRGLELVDLVVFHNEQGPRVLRSLGHERIEVIEGHFRVQVERLLGPEGPALRGRLAEGVAREAEARQSAFGASWLAALARVTPRYVNVGAGDAQVGGALNVDVRALPGIDVVADARRLPFRDGSVDRLMAEDLIEHFPIAEVDDTLAEWLRALRPGGRIRVQTPDLRALARGGVARPPLDPGGSPGPRSHAPSAPKRGAPARRRSRE
jgi:hypothetical protein